MKKDRKPIRLEDLVADPRFPVGKYQPSKLPELKDEPLSPEVVESLQGPAAMLCFDSE